MYGKLGKESALSPTMEESGKEKDSEIAKWKADLEKLRKQKDAQIAELVEKNARLQQELNEWREGRNGERDDEVAKGHMDSHHSTPVMKTKVMDAVSDEAKATSLDNEDSTRNTPLMKKKGIDAYYAVGGKVYSLVDVLFVPCLGLDTSDRFAVPPIGPKGHCRLCATWENGFETA
jgi:hypothetical protein